MNITIAFIMFGVALEIKIENFRRILSNPKSAIIGILSQFLLLPAVTFLLVWLIQPSSAVALGMILVAACPGGNISNFISSLAKGNIALSVSLTAFATTFSGFLTPFNFVFWGGLYMKFLPLEKPMEIPIFQVFQTVFILLGLPLIGGIWFANRYPKITKRITKTVKIASIIIFIGFIVGALAANFDNFIKYVYLIIPIVLIHNLLALFTGFSVSKLFRLPNIDTKSVTIETGIQNSGLALVLIFNNKIFPAGMGGIAFIAAWWGIWHIISGLLISFFWSKMK
jgi:BASS family bile acid:Na+ symporter